MSQCLCGTPSAAKALSYRTVNTGDDARLDVAVNGFWGGPFEKAFIDVRVFNPSGLNNKRDVITNREFVKWSMLHLHLSCFPPPGEWAEQL